MRTHIIEVTNGELNWGKFMLGEFTHEWERRSEIDTASSRPLLAQIGWGRHVPQLLVLDLQTGEGAVFRLGGLARADLQKHKVWVCPMFEPFLEWLYAYYSERAQLGDGTWWEGLPLKVDLPAAPFAIHGYRREGPPELTADERAVLDVWQQLPPDERDGFLSVLRTTARAMRRRAAGR